MRIEEMEGMVAVGPELAVVVVRDDEFKVVTLERAAPVDASEDALDEGTPGEAGEALRQSLSVFALKGKTRFSLLETLFYSRI